MKITPAQHYGAALRKPEYQPHTGQRCHCRPGQHRDNCPDCEGTGWKIDFAAIRARRLQP